MQGPDGVIRWLRYLGQVGLLAAAYFVAAKASLMLAIPPGYATAVWPPSGIALAALLLLGPRVWPGIWLGAALANLTVASSPFAALAIGSGNTLEALAGAMLVHRHIAGTQPYFDRVRNVVKFIAIAAMCSTVAATIGVGSLALGGAVPWPEFLQNWWTWWHGDAAGIIIVTPLILNWKLRQNINWSPAKILEAAGFVFSLLLTAYFVFGNGTRYFSSLPLTFLILPLIIWAAFRFSRREVTTAGAVVCSIAVWYTIDGRGPFADESLNLSLLLLLAFISTSVATGLMLSAAVDERSRATGKLAQALHDLQEQASTDPLTGLSNRRHLWEFLLREWIRSRRREGSLAVIMMDLDYFKRVNDEFGHEAGDVVLTEIAALLKAHIRGSDIACRFGGEEFALVLPDATLEAVQRRAENIRAAIHRLDLKYRGQPLGGITASFGIALAPDHAGDPESLLRASDRALYEAKAAGRDRIVVSSARNVRAKQPRKTEAA
jgi:diguanylate cyclase (GGDEF)-like protein